LLGGGRGAARLVHPNDDVNRSQSSNDVVPSAVQVAGLELLLTRVRPAAEALRGALAAKAARFGEVVKLGRTHLQDATPMTVGQELGAFATQVSHGLSALDAALPLMGELALGGTAVGTGLNAPQGYAARVAQVLAEQTGLPLKSAPDKFAALAASDGLVQAHGALKLLATACFKLANDVRLLASGPRAGLGEYLLPENEPGSSIMPGKVNPTQAEMLAMVAVQVMANDVAVSFAGASGPLQLNVYRPLLAYAFLQSCRILADGMDCFRAHLVEGLELDLRRIEGNLQRSLMLATALSPHLGYDKAAQVARKAHLEGASLKEAALALGFATAAQLDAWLDPATMLGP
jgi:fumarate hydratase class II